MIGLEQLSPIIYGAGAFNNVQYSQGDELNAEDALRAAFNGGINAIDTSAYYGESEIIVGKALKALKDEFPRESYFLCTKAGRWENNTFDYSPQSITRSVERSLQRLSTDYLDALLIHDVEFKTETEALAALETAFKLKAEGVVRFVGFSGLPLSYLATLAESAQHKLQSVDLILSYCNLTIQNRTLLNYKSRLQQAGVKLVLNASPLGMSLLRSGETHGWHPAPEKLKEKTSEIAKELEIQGVELADLAEQYAFSAWSPTVIGMRSAHEVHCAIDNLEKSKSPDTQRFEYVEKLYGDLMDVLWPSGIH